MSLETMPPDRSEVTDEEGQVPFDPFELEDTVSGNIRDPYPRMAELRRESPVHVGPVDLGDGAHEADPSRPQPVTVFGFDESVQVLRDNETFSSTVYEGVMGAVMGRTILQMDEPEHRLHRALVSPTFRSKVLEQWEGDLVQRVVNELIDGFAARGTADLVQELTFNFPVQVIARILGLPRADFPTFQRWAIGITSVASNWERGMAASEALRDYFADVLEERRRRPTDDLISELVVAEVDGRTLDDEEIYSFLRLLLPAGVETTYRASGNMLYGLLTNPDQLDAVRQDRSLMPDAFEETIRWEPPVTVILRRASRDTEIGRRAGGGGRRRGSAARLSQPRRAEVRAPRRLRRLPGLASECGFRLRRARVPRHASGPHGDPGGHQHAVRPLARPAAGPGPGPRPPHQGHGLPLTDRPAGGLHPVLTGAGRCDTPYTPAPPRPLLW